MLNHQVQQAEKPAVLGKIPSVVNGRFSGFHSSSLGYFCFYTHLVDLRGLTNDQLQCGENIVSAPVTKAIGGVTECIFRSLGPNKSEVRASYRRRCRRAFMCDTPPARLSAAPSLSAGQ